MRHSEINIFQGLKYLNWYQYWQPFMASKIAILGVAYQLYPKHRQYPTEII